MIRSLLIAFTLLCSTSVLAESQTLAQYLNLTGIQMDQVNHAFTKAQEQINNISTDQLSKGVIIDSLRGTWNEGAVKNQIDAFMRIRGQVIYIKLKTLDDLGNVLSQEQKQKAVEYFLYGPE